MTPAVLCNCELCCSCICTYALNGNLQYLLKSNVEPVTIVCRLSVVCIPLLCGKQFNQNTVLYAISTISGWGRFSNGSVFVMALILSLIVLIIYLSTSGTSLSWVVVFSIMPIIAL